MTLLNDRQLINTREKLARLEARYQARLLETNHDSKLRRITLQSLKRTINQFKEEIARYEAHHPAARS